MLLTISYDGRHFEAVLLAVSRERMRLAVRGRAETLEFRLVDGEWTGEQGDKIELEALVTDGRTDVNGLREQLFPMASAARQ
ncbi:MAG TPA: hypothetical protein VJ732_17395 [Bryobacteraceae bacterium]|nr:hypothetical protein [Bryobacteraceae bacterium]